MMTVLYPFLVHEENLSCFGLTARALGHSGRLIFFQRLYFDSVMEDDRVLEQPSWRLAPRTFSSSLGQRTVGATNPVRQKFRNVVVSNFTFCSFAS